MTDRQDIDALLIGSLYGELDSTEEARLAAHLESHPADRTALANLEWARNAVRESRILQVQVEPPQSISALLLQEAHRRAPKPPEEASWFQRFVRAFMLHPAVAAAAMLVVVIGVAGTMYLRSGDQFAKQTADDRAELAPAAEPPAALTQGSAGTDQYRVQLDETGANKLAGQDEELAQAQATEGKNDGKHDGNGAVATVEGVAKNRPAPPQKAAEKSADKKGDQLGFANERRDRSVAKAEPGRAEKQKKPARSYIEVTTPDRAPKDFGATASRGRVDSDLGDSQSSRTTVTGTPRAPAEQVPVAPSVGAAPPPAPPPAPATKERPDPMLAWAKQQHGLVIKHVKAGNCSAAASVALQIASRAPAYYASAVEDDIAIKTCKAYITQQREKEAERVQRAKATQRRAVESK